MARRVLITGLGTTCGCGVGIDALWDAACEGTPALARISQFEPSGFGCQIAGEMPDYKIRDYVPKHYRKATKVMARDIEIAVIAADQAVRDAGLVTPGTDADADRTYAGNRSGCHIGAGLIAADLDELTLALATAVDDDGNFDYHKWGAEGINNLTPLWLLKYLPNMLACHVTILHDAQGPSNTITCGEASGGLSVGESLRVIQRGAADLEFSGGAESKINPMAYFRQHATGRLTTQSNDDPASAVRPYDTGASGTVLGEGGGIITLESAETAEARGASAYAELAGFGASHTVYPPGKGLEPDPEGRGIASAIRAAVRDASVEPDAIDAAVLTGTGIPTWDAAEASAMGTVFGERAASIPLWSAKPLVGSCGAGAGGVDIAMAARMVRDQKIPARINCDSPIAGVNAGTSPAVDAALGCVLVVSTSVGGQNAALILKKV